MKFESILGQTQIKERLLATITGSRISHAQLFVSHEGVGALPLAIAYAQRVLCSSPGENGDSCGVCGNCYKMSKLEHPDCNFVFPVNRSKKAKATGRADEKPTSDQFIHLWRPFIIQSQGYITEEQWYQYIGIENQQGIINKEEANELVRKMSFKSVQGSYKIVIIWLPEKMHESAANTLLKLIEEPAEKTLFLFVSAEADKIISTIRSRTQIINIAPLPQQLIADELTRLGYDNVSKIAQAAAGSLAYAIELAKNSCQSDDYDRFVELMRKGYTSKYSELFDWAEQMAAIGRESQKMFCENSLDVLRDCYLTSINMRQLTHTTPQSEKFVEKFAPYVNHLTIEPFVKEFELLLRHISQNGNAKILFADFALRVSKILNLVKGKR